MVSAAAQGSASGPTGRRLGPFRRFGFKVGVRRAREQEKRHPVGVPLSFNLGR